MDYGPTKKARQRRIIWWFCIAVAVLVIFVGSWAAFSKMNEGLQEQAELSIRNAILNSAKQCCAIEGSYPSSLRYLEENYGLVVNHDRYAITYEAFAANVMPSVVVTKR